jgi:hypothetical protein
MTVSLCGGHRICDSDDGAPLARGGEDCFMEPFLVLAAFSPGGRRIMSVNKSGRIRLWDSHTGIELITLCTATPSAEPSVPVGFSREPVGLRQS